MIYYVFDVEADGLLDTITKLHCLSYQKMENGKILEQKTLTNYKDIEDFFKEGNIYIGHNIKRYDIPAIELILETTLKGTFYDTLGVSWYLYPFDSTYKHNLEIYGERLGIKKPEIENWTELPLEVYIERCEEDVKINTALFIEQMKYLLDIYNGEEELIPEILTYVTFILDCLREQEKFGIPLDSTAAMQHLLTLEYEFQERKDKLQSKMPKEVLKKAPKIMFKKDGSLSSHGEKWKTELIKRNLPLDSTEIYQEGNAGSHSQIKDWLFSLGWNPITFKVSKATDKKIPQVSLPFGGGICPSVKQLFKKYPYLEDLEGIYVIRHRISIFKAFLEKESNGKVYASAHSLTNTLRLTHSSPCVNLPKPSVYYGSEIRSCFIVPDDNHIIVGSDISGLEDNTKQHFIYPYDPKYVEEMRVPGFDAHLDIGVLAGLLTKEDEEFYKTSKKLDKLSGEDEKRFNSLDNIRFTSKTCNFAMTYNAFPPKIAETAKITLEEAENIFKVYWERNWAIKKIADSAKIKKIRYKDWRFEGKTSTQLWVKNPLNGFWYFLKDKKDVFSTLNQGTGSYVFNIWLKKVREKLSKYSIPVLFQYHDELFFICEKSFEEEAKEILHSSIDETWRELNLNVSIKIDIKTGKNYKEVH